MDTKEKIVCFKCKEPSLHEDSKFCHKCGFLLNSNFCSNEFCYIYNNGDRIPLPEDARYCDECGNETEYFKNGLLEPIKD